MRKLRSVLVGSQTFKTRVIDDNLSPKWNEFFEAVVDQASGQKLRVEVGVSSNYSGSSRKGE